MHIGAAESFRVHSDGWDTVFEVTGSNGIGWFKGDARAPIFYDSNDTYYFLDPNSTSRTNVLGSFSLRNNYTVDVDHTYGIYFDSGGSPGYGIYRESGSWAFPYPDLRISFHTGIKLGANSSYNGIRFYTDTDMATQVMSVNNGSDGVGGGNVYVNNILVAGDSLRATIFYDSNNTAYYADPSGTSNFQYSRSYYWWTTYTPLTSPRWDTSFYVLQSQHWYGHSGSQEMYLGESGNHISIRGYSTADGSFRAPIFYDSNNTAYYLNPNGGSYFAGSLEIANGYFLTNGIGGAMYMTSVSGSFGGYLRTSGHMVLDQINTGYNVYVLDGNSVGVVKNAGSQSWSAFSDATIKTVHSTMEDNLSKLESITPIYYSFNNFADDKNRIGLIAQEVQEHFPELVEVEPRTEKLTLDYTGLIPVLLGAIKELKTEIETLKTKQ
jgi:hypothetical protein